jgi:hypothetical protein
MTARCLSFCYLALPPFLLVALQGCGGSGSGPPTLSLYSSGGSGKEFTPEQLHDAYFEIFPSGNRNAASYKWFTFIKQKKEKEKKTFDFEHLNKFYCPISGSPTGGTTLAQVSLPRAGRSDETKAGSFSFCCSPCVCDMQDFVHVDTVLVEGQKHSALVIGNPCARRALVLPNGRLDVTFTDPFDPSVRTSLAESAPDVVCDCAKGDGPCSLVNATLSEQGHPIIGLLHKTRAGEDLSAQANCDAREDGGFRSGMGLIFRKVAEINPVETNKLL